LVVESDFMLIRLLDVSSEQLIIDYVSIEMEHECVQWCRGKFPCKQAPIKILRNTSLRRVSL